MVWIDDENGDYADNPAITAAKTTLSFGNHYTALNDSVVKRLKMLGVNDSMITIVPNGVDSTKFYYSESARDEIRQSMGVSNSTLVFITVGLVIDRKGQFDFLRILQSLGIDYQYWIIGKGPDVEKIEKYIKNEKIENKVKLLGYIQDKEIYKYHSAADIYAHSSYYEAQALSEIEAYSCGLRIIVNEKISDTVIGDVKNNPNNYLVVDFDQISKNEVVLWFNKIVRDRQSRNQYDWQKIANMYAKVYNDMKNK